MVALTSVPAVGTRFRVGGTRGRVYEVVATDGPDQCYPIELKLITPGADFECELKVLWDNYHKQHCTLNEYKDRHYNSVTHQELQWFLRKDVEQLT